ATLSSVRGRNSAEDRVAREPLAKPTESVVAAKRPSAPRIYRFARIAARAASSQIVRGRASVPGDGSCGFFRIVCGEQQSGSLRTIATNAHRCSVRFDGVDVRLDRTAALSALAKAWA